jgi:hypothetical protein
MGLNGVLPTGGEGDTGKLFGWALPTEEGGEEMKGNLLADIASFRRDLFQAGATWSEQELRTKTLHDFFGDQARKARYSDIFKHHYMLRGHVKRTHD